MSQHESFSPLTPRLALGSIGWLDAALLRAVDLGLAGCIFLVPVLMGGRQALGQLVLVALSLVVAMAWAVRQAIRGASWRSSGAEWLLSAGVILVLLQMAPLPEPMLAWLAPHHAKMLPLWTAQGDAAARLGAWTQISLTPAETRLGLVLFASYALLFLVAVERMSGVEDVERLLRWLAIAGVLLAAFGLVQLVTSNGKFFWIYEHPFSDTSDAAKGSFTNRNHFAHFLALAVGPAIWWVQHALRRGRGRPGQFGASRENSDLFRVPMAMRVIGLGILAFACLLSLSRGGTVVLLAAAAISVAVCYRARTLGIRFVAGLGAAALLIAAALVIFGYQQVSERLDELTTGSLEVVDRAEARRSIWGTTVKAVPDYLVLGAGVGSFRQVYPMYMEWQGVYLYYTHSENGYLQVLLETGVAGLALVLAGIGCCAFWCLRGLRRASSGRVQVAVGAVAAGLAASVLHSAVDFVWYVPACMAIVALLAACACRLGQLAAAGASPRPRRASLPRPAAWAAVAVLAVGGVWALADRFGPVVAEPHWERFLMLDRASNDPLPLDGRELDDQGQQQLQVSLEAEQKAVAQLEEVVRWNPDHAEAHLRLATAYLRLFHIMQQNAVNVMPLDQIRESAIASRFPSRQALDQWLAGAVGEHVKYLDLAMAHTRRGLALCPLMGEGYLFLSDLCFLEGAAAATKSAYVAQAMLVRPFDGGVLFKAGLEAYYAGDEEQFLLCWQRSFHRGRMYQHQMIEQYAGHAPPQMLEGEIQFFLDNFQPDLYALRLLHRRYGALAPPEQLVALRRAYLAALEAEIADTPGRQAAPLWFEAHLVWTDLGQPATSLDCLRKAVDADPNSFEYRRRLGRFLAAAGRFAEAEQQFQWCLARKPGFAPLENEYRTVRQMRAETEGPPPATAGRIQEPLH